MNRPIGQPDEDSRTPRPAKRPLQTGFATSIVARPVCVFARDKWTQAPYNASAMCLPPLVAPARYEACDRDYRDKNMAKRLAAWLSSRRALAAVSVIGFLLVSAYLVRGLWRSYLVGKELASLRRQGIPTTAEELNTFVAIPPGEPNATAAWNKPINSWATAIGMHPWGFRMLDYEGEFPPSPGTAWDELDRAKAYLTKHAAYYKLIDDAVATVGACCYISDYKSDDVLLPHVDAMRPIVRHLALRAFVRAHQGDHDGALGDIQAMISAAESFKDEPIMITQLVRGSLLDFITMATERLLVPDIYPEEMLGQYQETLGQIDVLSGLRLSLIGQRVMGLEYLTDSNVAVARRALLGDHPVEFLLIVQRIDDGFNSNWSDALRLSQKFEPLDWDDTSMTLPWGRTMYAGPSKFMEVLPSKVSSFAVYAVRLRCCAAGIAAYRFQAANGRWPQSLDELTPEFLLKVPTDPFTGGPLRFIRDKDEIRIYSVGPNRQDDGGVEAPETDDDGDLKFSGEPDVVFRVRLE